MENIEISNMKSEIERLKSKCHALEVTAKRLGLDVDLITNNGQGSGDGAFVPDFWIGVALGIIKIEIDDVRANNMGHLVSDQGREYALQIARQMIGNRPGQNTPRR